MGSLFFQGLGAFAMLKLFICVLCTLLSTHVFGFFSKQQTMQLSLDQVYEKITLCTEPDWVQAVSYSGCVSEQKGLSIADLLYDSQINFQTGQYYFRHVSCYLNSKGVQDFSTLEIEFNPAVEKIQIHEVSVLRQGKLINKLPSAQIRILHPASDSLVYQGDETLTLFFDDLRVGDILDYSYTRVLEKAPIHVGFNIDELANKITCRWIASKDQTLFVRSHFLDDEPVHLVTENTQEYLLEIQGCKKSSHCDEAPSWYSQSPYVEISTTDNWGDIVRFYQEQTFPQANQASLDMVYELTQNWALHYLSQEDQIAAAIRFVSDDIFYRSMHEGELLQKAHQPCDVLKQRYGDCKDKTLLLVELLKGLGLEAYPALVDTQLQYQLQSMLPGNYFNHAVVYYSFGGKSYFLDPTIQNLGGQGDSYWMPDYGFALVLKDDTYELTKMPLQGVPKRVKEVCFKIDEKQKSAVYQDKTQFFHAYADTLRYQLQVSSEESVAQTMLKSLQNDFGPIEMLDPCNFEDDFKGNKITKSLSCLIKQIGEYSEDGIIYDFKPSCQLPYIPESVVYEGPVALEMIDSTEVIDIDWVLQSFELPTSHREYQDDVLAYSVDWIQVSDHQLRVVLSYKVLKPWIDSSALPFFADKIKELQTQICVKIKVPLSGRTKAGRG